MAAGEKSNLFAKRMQKKLPPFAREGMRSPNEMDDPEIVFGIAKSHSPYLASLIEKWPNICEKLHSVAPEKIFEGILEKTSSDFEYDALKPNLRLLKQQAHLLVALCDLAGVWTWEQITEALSAFADKAMACLINAVANDMGFEPSAERGPVPGLFVLALGKYGARELNYSSDIDLIVFYDPDHIQLPDMNKAERTLIRFIQKLMRGFDEVIPEGYVFRTDLRLRPDPRSNSVAVSTVAAERYYETLGQNWERAAMIKARFCGGDSLAAQDFIKNIITPFIWRRSLDYAAIADIHSIKRQIQGQAKPKDVVATGHDLKLGIGGIREIEFYAQVQQLILGGRHKSLRCPKTVDALKQLAKENYIDMDIADQMTGDYALLRDLEHRVQMIADEQTHNWPHAIERRSDLLALYGGENLQSFETDMECVFVRVHKTYSDLFPDEEDLSSPLGSLVFTGVEPEPMTLATLTAYGFERSPQVWRQMADWLGGRIRATRTPRARELLTRLAPRIIEFCGSTNEPDAAFFTFSDFITNLNAGVTLFSMFKNKPEALNAVVEMLVLAPPLANMLSDQPSLIDAMIEPNFLIQKGSIDKAVYRKLIDKDDDFETALNIVRRAVHEDQFSLTAGLLNLQNLQAAGERFTEIATAAIDALLPCAIAEIERLFGQIYGQFAVLGFGKLGGHEMSHGSDLDIVLVYDIDPKGADSQEEQVDKFNKLTRRIVTALSISTEAGGLYEVDMALRPSGRSGPLAVNLPVFEKYYQEDAWTWEFMALSRASVVSGSSDEFIRRVELTIDGNLQSKSFGDDLIRDVLDMHERLARDKPSNGFWDIKGKPGGLRDIEFIAQYLVLENKLLLKDTSTVSMLEQARKNQMLAAYDAELLINICVRYQSILQLLKLAADGNYESDELPHSLKLLLSVHSSCSSFKKLEQQLTRAADDVTEIFKKTVSLDH